MQLFSKFTVLGMIVFLGLAAPANPVYAQVIDAAGAAQVKQAVDDALSYYLMAGEKQGQGLAFRGPVEVTPKSGYYEVRIPDVKLGNDTDSLTVGTVVLNVTPDANGDYRTSIALPQQMSMKDKDGTERMTITLGQQKFSGIWRPALNLFTQAVADYGDIAVKIIPTPGAADSGSPVTITIGSMKTQIAMQPDGEMWSGPQSTSVADVAFAFGANATNRVTLDKMDVVANYKKIDLSLHKKLREELKRHMGTSGKELSPEAVRAVMQSTFSNLQSLPENVETRLNLAGLDINLAKQDGGAATDASPATPARGPLNLRLESGSSESNLIGLKSDNGTGTAKWRLQGLSVQGMDGPMTGAIPNEVSLNMTAGSVPFKSALEAILNATENALTAQSEAQSAAEAKAQSRLYVQQALSTLPTLLAKAGTTFGISDTYMQAPDLSSSLDGQLKAVETSPYAFAGTMTLTMTGMDELITKLQEMARTSANPRAAGWAQMLIMMQLSGQQDTTAEGKSRRTYAIELKPDGAISLNGADLGGILPRGATPPAPAATVPTTPTPKP